MSTLRHLLLPLLAFSLLVLGAVPTAQAADIKYLPDDTEIVITVNFRQILTSELAKAHKEAIDQVKGQLEGQIPPDAHKYLKLAGFDLFKDLTSITLALPAKNNPKDGVIFVEGSFQPDKFYSTAEEAAKDKGEVLKVTKMGDYNVIEITPPRGDAAFLALANKNLLVASSTRDQLAGTLARISGDQKATLKKQVKSLLETTNSKQSISAVATGKAIAKLLESAKLPDEQVRAFAPALQTIQGISAALTIAKDVQFQVGIGTKNAETANQFAKATAFPMLIIKNLVAQKAQEDQKLMPVVDIVNTLRVTTQGSSLIFRGEASLENIDKLIKNYQPR